MRGITILKTLLRRLILKVNAMIIIDFVRQFKVKITGFVIILVVRQLSISSIISTSLLGVQAYLEPSKESSFNKVSYI